MMQSAVSANGKSDKEKIPMEKKISCCGTVCSDCEYYSADCQGCGEIKGKVFWLEYTGESCCDIYECCINQKNMSTAVNVRNCHVVAMTMKTRPKRRKKMKRTMLCR